MVPRSFVFLPGIGEKREVSLWRAGITHWDEYPRERPPKGIPATRHAEHRRLLETAVQALAEQDHSTLARLIPANEHWRFWNSTSTDPCCLDIETTGTHHGARVTVVGIHDVATGRSRQLVAGDDLDGPTLKKTLAPYDLVVTFNGNGFDLPVLHQHYPQSVPGVPHLDLRGPLRRIGYTGGLKRIENALGLHRDDGVHGIDGWEAVRLWHRHERGDEEALDTLLAYNDADIRNLVPLARFVTTVLANRHAPLLKRPVAAVPWPAGRPDSLPRPLARLLAQNESRLFA